MMQMMGRRRVKEKVGEGGADMKVSPQCRALL